MKILLQVLIITLTSFSAFAATEKIWSCTASCIYIDEGKNQLFQLVNPKSVDGAFEGTNQNRSEAFSIMRKECIGYATSQGLNTQKVHLTRDVSAERSESHSASQSGQASKGGGLSIMLLGGYHNESSSFSNSQSDAQGFKYHLPNVNQKNDCIENDYDPTQAPNHVGLSEVKG